jgi:hypothetical protein
MEVTEEVKQRAAAYYRQRVQEKADEFTRRLDAGDPDATVQIEMAGQRDTFEEESFRRFFARHINIVECEASRSMLSEYFHGDIITLGGLEQALESMRERLPKRTI